ncbi:hypothetical protein CC1G_01952 [Coprinopsis cinerea okayama7|uniref:N-acetyl-D-glucosamine kinase n=1 Tax=Coprinopsis cinerea (strain Okayama-7 / 130 / ATCC MYA-4618 / FGSC 9003) TaxID=240176 RepID=A8N629_COPC7|nr:hypothetical protein CC1G_01952 [Coprinopsis cinerea okayama7\|eukprot:XP_001830316.1 hypothetical protein CC1G_01952 [Coprinopsis cinerea okayama7\
MSLFLCVDCGGTKTAVVIAGSSGAIVGRGTGGPSNITYLSIDAFIDSINKAIVQALKETRPSDPSIHALPFAEGIVSPFVAAWFGVSGADSPAAIAKVTPAISKLIGIPAGPNLVIANDTHLLAAPMRMYPDIDSAIAVIGGTGSIGVSFKIGAEGKIEELGRVGGWGWILGDEGGGYDVGRETLRQILREEDHASVTGQPSPPSKLKDRVLKRFGVDHVMEIFGIVYHGDPTPSSPSEDAWAADDLRRLPKEKRISSLPRLVFHAAFEEDDWLAKQILKACAANLASQVAVLLGEGTKDAQKVVKAKDSVISFGGSLVGVEGYRKLILNDLAQRGYVFPHIHYVEDAAATGAIALATAYISKQDK